jgi:probable DNA repair protein
VRNALAARQWEAYYFDSAQADATGWPTPPLYSYRAWLNAAWRTTLAGDDPRALLTPVQSAALWRAIIEDSPAGRRLLDVRHAARWAEDAHRLLADWNLDASDVRSGDASADTRAFLAWQRSYRDRLVDSGWLDEPGLERESRCAPREPLALLDLFDPTPAQSALFETLKSQGFEVESRTPPTVECAARQIARRDFNEELETAAEWVRARIRADPRARLALIVPELVSEPAAVRQRIRRAFRTCGPSDEEMPALALARGGPLDSEPAIGAALCALELSAARATFATLSRWLRSPFFHAPGQAQVDAAAAEVALRSELASQLPFLTAYERAGLAGRLDALAPDLGERLRAGLRELQAPRPAATPDVWARAWSRGLGHLGWPAPGCGVNDVVLRGWEEALTSFAQLTPILGPCGQDTAIARLEGIIAARGPAARLPLHGLHVLARIDDVGPAYTGVWVTGVTDRSWPEPVRLNPLLPAQLQIERGMPRATPTGALARARASMARLLARTPEVVFSWPRVVHDYAATLSPLLVGIPAIEEVGLGLRPRARAATEQNRLLVPSLDPAPVFKGARIPGGARTIDLQARSPIRAFCETRLHARELRPPPQGLSPRHQGIAAHRALELLFRRRPSQQALGASSPPASDDIAASVQRALAELFGPARSALTALFELEGARLRALLRRFVETELERPPFRTVGVEERAEIRIGDFTIAGRLDRLDELADGTLALIDYKTGTRQPTPRWLDEPLTSAQLPLYALEVGPKLAALVTVGLGGETISYDGAARAPGLVANTLRAVPDEESWTAQIERWRGQIGTLVEEYAGGDVRVYTEDWSDAAAAYAPLTRVYARGPLHRARGQP